MDRTARASSAERAELFRGSAAILHPERSPAIIEKDFWVCWALHRIYDVLKFRPELIFKGGTSLSKAYNAIDRFSEDVDLSLSRHVEKSIRKGARRRAERGAT
jgi:predicted nucleotidyltransferase component of viral defense system